MAAVMLRATPSFYTDYSRNSLFNPKNTYGKHLVSKGYCIARNDDKICFLPICDYRKIILGDIEELLQNLDAFCFDYQHVECLCILFSYLLSGKIVKSEQLFDIVQFNSITRTKEWTEYPAWRKRHSCGKNIRNIC